MRVRAEIGAPTWPRRAAGFAAAGAISLYLLVKVVWIALELLRGTADWVLLNAVTVVMAVAGIGLGLALALVVGLPLYLRDRWPWAFAGRAGAGARTRWIMVPPAVLAVLWTYWAAGGTAGLDPSAPPGAGADARRRASTAGWRCPNMSWPWGRASPWS
ncbi:hypothetical protein AB0C28_09395 [Nonomuraea sp. NPDC048892]|uniref:hypothetical protein n=1 Tax=Nonomuraea sp. NPDC048892 TaxID=3154624 RepID=UPI0033F2D5BE